MNPNDTTWTRIFGYIPPAFNSEKHCRCACHGVVRNIAGTTVIEGRLGVLDNEVDNVVACAACQVSHYKAVLRRRASEAA